MKHTISEIRDQAKTGELIAPKENESVITHINNSNYSESTSKVINQQSPPAVKILKNFGQKLEHTAIQI